MSENYKKVEALQYVREGLLSGELVPFVAEKSARPIIRQGVVGEEIISWSVDKQGRPIKEMVDVVKIDPETGNPGWVVTKAENGMPVIDEHGHLNQWINTDTEYHKRYEPAPELGEGVHKPVGGPQIFVEISEAISIFQWGSQMDVDAGGYANITNLDNIYVISGRDFKDLYRRIEPASKVKKISE